MNISFETVKNIIIIILIIFPIFMFIYYKKGDGHNIIDYLNAVYSYFVLSIMIVTIGLFMVVGIDMVVYQSYLGIIFILFSMFMLYHIIKIILDLFKIKNKL